jgi:type IV secretion system protein TrbL
MSPKFEVLTKLLNVFLFHWTGGANRITPDALWLLGILFGGELILKGIYFVLRREIDWPSLIQTAITGAVFLWLITNWVPLTKVLAQGFIGAGLKVGGDAISETDFTDPDNIALYGFSVTGVVFAHLNEYSGLDGVKNIKEILLSGIGAFLVVMFYFGMASIVFISLLEFYLSTAVTVILLPWGIFKWTAWLTEKALAHVFASGVRLLVLSTILGTALPVLYTTGSSMSTGFDAVLRMLCGALALLMLCWRANSFAQGLVHGGPALALTDATRTLQTVANQFTQLGTVLQALTDVLSRSDPQHSSRQPATSRRRL